MLLRDQPNQRKKCSAVGPAAAACMQVLKTQNQAQCLREAHLDSAAIQCGNLWDTVWSAFRSKRVLLILIPMWLYS